MRAVRKAVYSSEKQYKILLKEMYGCSIQGEGATT